MKSYGDRIYFRHNLRTDFFILFQKVEQLIFVPLFAMNWRFSSKNFLLVEVDEYANLMIEAANWFFGRRVKKDFRLVKDFLEVE